MEEEKHGNTAEGMDIQYCSARMMSSEIVEIVEDSKSIASTNRDGGIHDVYVAVGKDDLDVLKWALDHAVSPGARVFLVHVFPAITYIPTPGNSINVWYYYLSFFLFNFLFSVFGFELRAV